MMCCQRWAHSATPSGWGCVKGSILGVALRSPDGELRFTPGYILSPLPGLAVTPSTSNVMPFTSHW